MAAPPTPFAPTGAATVAFTGTTAYPVGNGVRVKYTLAHDAWVRVRVIAPDGTVVRSLGNVRATAGKKYTALWDGKDRRGRLAPLRHYTITIFAEDGAGTTVVKKPLTLPTIP